jgi:hypothetical protein
VDWSWWGITQVLMLVVVICIGVLDLVLVLAALFIVPQDVLQIFSIRGRSVTIKNPASSLGKYRRWVSMPTAGRTLFLCCNKEMRKRVDQFFLGTVGRGAMRMWVLRRESASTSFSWTRLCARPQGRNAPGQPLASVEATPNPPSLSCWKNCVFYATGRSCAGSWEWQSL